MRKMTGWLGVAAIVIGSVVAMGQEAAAIKKQTVCPVMGGKINTSLFVDYEGKRIYACCSGCLPELKKDPAKYVEKLEKSGVTLDKAEPKGK